MGILRSSLAAEQHAGAQPPPHLERFLPPCHAVDLAALAAETAARPLMVGKRAGYLAELAFLVRVANLGRAVSFQARQRLPGVACFLAERLIAVQALLAGGERLAHLGDELPGLVEADERPPWLAEPSPVLAADLDRDPVKRRSGVSGHSSPLSLPFDPPPSWLALLHCDSDGSTGAGSVRASWEVATGYSPACNRDLAGSL